jgi:hypothetical protein
MNWDLILGFAGGATIATIVIYLVGPAVPTSPASSADVSSLIDRLKPLTRGPESAWEGISVQFSGGGVRINMTLPNGNELKSRSDTLEGAVAKLIEPTDVIKSALTGWKPAPGVDKK